MSTNHVPNVPFDKLTVTDEAKRPLYFVTLSLSKGRTAAAPSAKAA